MQRTNKKSLGLYIHVPFCKGKCLYCDFCSVAGADATLMENYVSSLCACILEKAKAARDYEVDTVYIGGGTPTVLPIRQLSRVLDACFSGYGISKDAEITVECNPATGGEEYFSDMRKMSVNRLSVGLQSANDKELSALGRIHSYKDFVSTFNAARRAGFDNLSLDLMYGIPTQTRESFTKTLESATEMAPEHISAYCLKVEENTPFGKMGGELVLPDDDTVSDMYEFCCSHLEGSGYDRYEISNFARCGRESRHNLRYWQCKEYLGFGAAAHSYFGGERYAFSGNIGAFARGEFLVSEREKIDGSERMLEYVMLGLRLSRGISTSDFLLTFGADIFAAFPRLSEFIDSGHVFYDGERLAFTDKGVFVSSYILSEIFDFS